MTEPSPRPLTRRELRLAERSVPQAASSPRHPTPSSEATTPSPASPASSTTAGPGPAVRRRDLREAARTASCEPPFAVVRPGGPVVASTVGETRAGRRRAVRTGAAGRQHAQVAAKGLVTVALSGALVASGLSYVPSSPFSSPGYATAAEIRAAERAAELEARINAERSAEASRTRLTAQANAYAAAKRVEALALAEEALLTASTTADGAESVLGADGVAALEEAVADLSSLVAQAPAPAVAGPVDGADDAGRVATSRAAAPAPAPTPAAAPDTVDESAEAEKPAPTAEEPRAVVRTAEPERRAARPAPSPTAEPAPEQAPDAPAEGTVAAADVDPTAETDRATGSGADAAEDAAFALSETATLLALDSRTLDLDVTTELLAAAAQVDTLSQEVNRTAEETRAAQEAARAAAEAAAAERARKIAVASGAANGAIPADVLCAVDFDADARLRCDAAEALEKLNRAYREAFGHDLRINSTYRSYSAQVSTKASRGYLAATPGTSNHGHALAVDFDGFGAVGQFSSSSYRWMTQNAGAYGWVHPRVMQPGGGGPQEPWHWEYGTE